MYLDRLAEEIVYRARHIIHVILRQLLLLVVLLGRGGPFDIATVAVLWVASITRVRAAPAVL